MDKKTQKELLISIILGLAGVVLSVVAMILKG